MLEAGSYQSVSDIRSVQQGSVTGTSIVVSPTTISHKGEVTITVQNNNSLRTPLNADWIACYSPANSDITKTTPIRYQFANWTGTWGVAPSTSLKFKLNNLHFDYACYLFSGGLKSIPKLPSQQAYAANIQGTGANSFSKPWVSLNGGLATDSGGALQVYTPAEQEIYRVTTLESNKS